MAPFTEAIRRLSSTDGGVVFDLRSGRMFRVNQLGARVLDLMEHGDSPAQIALKLSVEFQVALTEVQTDVGEFVESLKLLGVITSL